MALSLGALPPKFTQPTQSPGSGRKSHSGSSSFETTNNDEGVKIHQQGFQDVPPEKDTQKYHLDIGAGNF